MKNLLLLLSVIFLPFWIGCSDTKAELIIPEEQVSEVFVPVSGTFQERIMGAKINGENVAARVVKLPVGNHFGEGRYMVYFKQPENHVDKQSPTFTQRVIVCVTDYMKPVVFVTQGYGLGDGWHFEEANYAEELVTILGCNQVVVEHRYFGKSTPSVKDWTSHTIENEVTDLHRINLVMKELFKNQKFISTGRSKGGQTAVYYESYYPKDIDIAVPYVAPICYQLNDRRHAEFLKKVGDESRRKQIKELQQEAFDRRDALLDMFRISISPASYNASVDIIFDLCILEYSFMCWQYSPDRYIPVASQLSDRDLLDEIIQVSPPTYFSFLYNPSFFMNVYRDGGYYGYDVKQFKNTVITQEQCDRWVEDIVVPVEGREFSFNPALGIQVKDFLKNNVTEKMIFIYGGLDTWSAAAVEDENFMGKNNMFKYVCPGGDHSTFIESFSPTIQQEIIGKLKKWLAE